MDPDYVERARAKHKEHVAIQSKELEQKTRDNALQICKDALTQYGFKEGMCHTFCKNVSGVREDWVFDTQLADGKVINIHDIYLQNQVDNRAHVAILSQPIIANKWDRINPYENIRPFHFRNSIGPTHHFRAAVTIMEIDRNLPRDVIHIPLQMLDLITHPDYQDANYSMDVFTVQLVYHNIKSNHMNSVVVVCDPHIPSDDETICIPPRMAQWTGIEFAQHIYARFVQVGNVRKKKEILKGIRNWDTSIVLKYQPNLAHCDNVSLPTIDELQKALSLQYVLCKNQMISVKNTQGIEFVYQVTNLWNTTGIPVKCAKVDNVEIILEIDR